MPRNKTHHDAVAPKNRGKTLYKTTIIIWSEYDPTDKVELVDLAREATEGSAYCSVMKAEQVKDLSKDKDWDGTDFFNLEDS